MPHSCVGQGLTLPNKCEQSIGGCFLKRSLLQNEKDLREWGKVETILSLIESKELDPGHHADQEGAAVRGSYVYYILQKRQELILAELLLCSRHCCNYFTCIKSCKLGFNLMW